MSKKTLLLILITLAIAAAVFIFLDIKLYQQTNSKTTSSIRRQTPNPSAKTPSPSPLASSPPASNLKSIPFESLDKQYFSGQDQKTNLQITNQQDWQTLWQTINSFQSPMPQLPHVDFSKEMVIAAFAGQFPNGGHSIEITQLKANDQIIQVSILTTSPGRKCGTTTAITQPYHLIKTALSQKKIEYLETTTVDNCQ